MDAGNRITNAIVLNAPFRRGLRLSLFLLIAGLEGPGHRGDHRSGLSHTSRSLTMSAWSYDACVTDKNAQTPCNGAVL